MKNVYIIQACDDLFFEVYGNKKRAMRAVEELAQAHGRTITETMTYNTLVTFWDDYEQIAEMRIEPVL